MVKRRLNKHRGLSYRTHPYSDAREMARLVLEVWGGGGGGGFRDKKTPEKTEFMLCGSQKLRCKDTEEDTSVSHVHPR